ncbi:MAG: phosphatase PAP2 family protein [Clostridiales bacterium]|nr:phosphatase PAP2 family protein [Clostridiales bacterium]
MDIQILNFVQEHCHNGLTDFIFPLITSLGNFGAVWIAAAVALLISKKYRAWGVMLLAVLLLTHVLGEYLIKPIVARPRPFLAFPGRILLIRPPAGYSFPSGHTATAFCSAVILWKADRRFGISAAVLAALIAFSRVFLFVHYPTDVLAGLILGVICAFVVIFVYNKTFKLKK